MSLTYLSKCCRRKTKKREGLKKLHICTNCNELTEAQLEITAQNVIDYFKEKIQAGFKITKLKMVETHLGGDFVSIQEDNPFRHNQTYKTHHGRIAIASKGFIYPFVLSKTEATKALRILTNDLQVD